MAKLLSWIYITIFSCIVSIIELELGFAGSLEEPFCILKKYVRDTVEKEEPLDQILVPMIENVRF